MTRHASVLLASATADGEELQRALGVPSPRGVLVVTGGTAELPGDVTSQLRPLLQEGLARVALERGLTVVTGATDAGIFRLLGAGVDRAVGAPWIGVAPAALVGDSAERTTTGAQRVALEPHHTHFVLVDGDCWGDETDAMLALIAALAADAPALVVVANGGEITKREVLAHVRAGREVVVLEGSGRLADTIADVVAGRAPAPDSDVGEIARGRITVLGRAQPVAALAELVCARLAPEPRP